MKRWLLIGALVLCTSQLQFQFTYTPLLQVVLNAIQQSWIMLHAVAFPVN